MEYLIKTQSIGGMTEEQIFSFCRKIATCGIRSPIDFTHHHIDRPNDRNEISHQNSLRYFRKH